MKGTFLSAWMNILLQFLLLKTLKTLSFDQVIKDSILVFCTVQLQDSKWVETSWMGSLRDLITWPTFGKHENSLLLKILLAQAQRAY